MDPAGRESALNPPKIPNFGESHETSSCSPYTNTPLLNTQNTHRGNPKMFRYTRHGGILSVLVGICIWQGLQGQDPLRFETEVALIKKGVDSLWDPARPALIFTGSSSIRMWADLQGRFPKKQILNTGFGGSQAADLLFYLEPLILAYRPEQVFIYEGDNDLAEGKRPGQVMRTLKEVKEKIHGTLPGIPIVFISAKPSISRWNLRRKYRRLNRRLLRWTRRDPSLFFADVWNPMLKGRHLDESLFIEDGLHMNSSGYDIWERVLFPIVEPEPKTPNP
jgi:lysophospholipase L1-like esterase